MPTYEGDNIVMLGQASRYVFKLVKRAQKNTKLPFPFEYISEMPTLFATKNRGATVEECLDLNVLRNALAVRAAKQIVQCSKSMAESQQPDKVKDNEIFGDEKLSMVKAHLRHVCMNLFFNQVSSCKFKDSRIEPLLMDLARVHILCDLIKDCGPVYEAGYFAPSAHSNLKKALEQVIKKLRPQMLPLAEVPYSTDEFNPSSIGNSYGDIYETQFEWARTSKLNN